MNRSQGQLTKIVDWILNVLMVNRKQNVRENCVHSASICKIKHQSALSNDFDKIIFKYELFQGINFLASTLGLSPGKKKHGVSNNTEVPVVLLKQHAMSITFFIRSAVIF